MDGDGCCTPYEDTDGCHNTDSQDESDSKIKHFYNIDKWLENDVHVRKGERVSDVYLRDAYNSVRSVSDDTSDGEAGFSSPCWPRLSCQCC